MTNFERTITNTVEELALKLMCPYDLAEIDCPCDSTEVDCPQNLTCRECTLKWLKEEEGQTNE